MHHAVLRSFFDRGKGKSAVYAVQGGRRGLKAEAPALLFSRWRKTLRVQAYFFSSDTKPSGFRPSFFWEAQNPQGSGLLFFKRHQTLRVQLYFFSRDTKPSGFSPSFFQETQNPQGSSLLFSEEHKTLRVQALFFKSRPNPRFVRVSRKRKGPDPRWVKALSVNYPLTGSESAAVTVLVLLAAAAGAGVVTADFLLHADGLLRLTRCGARRRLRLCAL